MPRIYLKQARLDTGLTQVQFAQQVGVERKAVIGWEAGTQDPHPLQIPEIRRILKSQDAHLFDNFREEDISFMDKLRRQVMEALAKLGGASLLRDAGLALVTTPVVEPEEYLAQ